MKAKRGRTPAEASLFEVKLPIGPSEHAMQASIAQWRKDGRTIDPSMSSELRTAARAVDLARGEGTWAMANALRVVVAARAAYGLTGAAEAGDPFDDFLRAMDDDRTDEAGAAGAEVRDRPGA